jgi:hypothetical protein
MDGVSSRLRLTVAAVIGAGVVALAPASASALRVVYFFKTSSGRIVCEWAPPDRFYNVKWTFILCGVTTGLRPAIPKTGLDCREFRYTGNRVGMRSTGRVELLPCLGDAQPFNGAVYAPVLRNGATWRHGGIGCAAATSSLICRNRDGHGFFLSPRHWRRF